VENARRSFRDGRPNDTHDQRAEEKLA